MIADTVPSDRRPPYQRSVREVLAAFQTDGHSGLSAAEARARLERYGPNELAAEKRVPEWRKLLAQFQDMLIILLLVAAAISIALWLHERESALPYEAIVILAVVVLNAVMGASSTALGSSSGSSSSSRS